PSRWMVQAPHIAIPQPNLVPCRPATSRIAHNNGMAGSASSVMLWPFKRNVVDMMTPRAIGAVRILLSLFVFKPEEKISRWTYFFMMQWRRRAGGQGDDTGYSYPHRFRRKRSCGSRQDRAARVYQIDGIHFRRGPFSGHELPPCVDADKQLKTRV